MPLLSVAIWTKCDVNECDFRKCRRKKPIWSTNLMTFFVKIELKICELSVL